MWVKQCHKQPLWEWFIPPIKTMIFLGDGADGIVLPTLHRRHRESLRKFTSFSSKKDPEVLTHTHVDFINGD